MKPWTIAVLLTLSGLALAVTPASWSHSEEADFAPGQFQSTVVSSRGGVSLSREIAILMSSGQAPPAVSALAIDGKTIYAASGVKAEVYKVQGREGKPFAELPGAMVTALCWTGKELLAGVGGEGAGLYAVDAEGKVSRRWHDPAVKYVWAILPGAKDTLYVATGPEAAVYAISADGGASLIYQAGKPAKNILCLARSKSGLLYAGTDENGLVVEINPTSKASRVVLDAEEKEISCLLVGESGDLYAATSEAGRAADRQAPSDHEGGRTVLPGPEATSQPEPEGEEGGQQNGEGNGDTEKSNQEPNEAAGNDTVGDEGSESPPAPPAVSNAEPSAPGPKPTPTEAPAGRFAGPPAAAGIGEGTGNAVYHIQADGLVRTIFRKPVTILAMKGIDGRIVLGTGNGGVVYSLTGDGEEVIQLARTDAKQVTALAIDADGRIVFGTSNKGSVAVLKAGIALEGTYTSKALDAQQRAQWGTARVRLSGPGQATFATRSGNVAEVDDKTWNRWSAEKTVGDGFLDITSQAGRFLQYRLTLRSAGKTGPAVRQVEVIYQVGNLPPVVSSIEVKPSTTPREGQQEQTGPQPYRMIRFTASDTNNDSLVYTITFRQVGAKDWVKLTDKLEQTNYVWDTRTVGDGVYEVRITASDSPANPPSSAMEGQRVSPPLIVDNTAPLVTAMAAKVAEGKVFVTGSAVDAGSRVAGIHYAVDSQQDWVAVLPKDGIADGGQEDFAFSLDDLKPGPHRLAIRVTDLFGNAGYGTLSVTTGQAASTTPATGESD
jgi:hypothetical protein